MLFRSKDNTLREIIKWIDFAKMRTRCPAVIIRAGQNLWKDPTFDVSWKNAKTAGMARGSYWFYDSRAAPKKQAELWVSLFAGDFGELPLFADFEDNYGGAFKGWRHWYIFLERIKELAPGREIGIYTAYYYWIENTTSVGIPNPSLEYFKQYPLWIANYGVSKPLVPKPWTNWTFWQFIDNGDGRIYGVESLNIDLNHFNGDLPTFYERFGLDGTLPEPGPEEKPRMYKVTVVWDDGTSEKNNPNTGGVAIKVWKKGASFDAVALVPDSTDPNNPDKLWAQKENGKYVAVWYPSAARGKVRCTWVEQEPGAEPEPTAKTVKVIVQEDGYEDVVVVAEQKPK